MASLFRPLVISSFSTKIIFNCQIEYVDVVTYQVFNGVILLLHLPFSFQLGYVIYRRVLRYYSGEEDGLGEYLHLTVVNLPFYLMLILSLTSLC